MPYPYVRLAAFYHASRMPTARPWNAQFAVTQHREGLLPNLTDMWVYANLPAHSSWI